MDSLKLDNSCKKNLISSYQQSFRIDDLLTSTKPIEQQPGHFCTPPPPPPQPATLQGHPHPTALQSPPAGHHHHHPLDKPADLGVVMGNGTCPPNGRVWEIIYTLGKKKREKGAYSLFLIFQPEIESWSWD